MPALTDTIVAASSPPGRSTRAVIRLAGPAVPDAIAERLDAPLTPRRLTPCRFRLDDRHDLPMLALSFPAPRSFTGDDVLELQLPGNPALLERVIDCLTSSAAAACRLAEPGEFTRRAFLAGRLDLTQAEGVAATIGALSDAELHAAALLRSGRLGEWSARLVDELAEALALVEAGIDFTDQDDVTTITSSELDARLARVESQLADILRYSRSWASIEALPWVVLVGEPNVGKSTLFNAMLGRERAVVSARRGTTRDVLAEPLTIGQAKGGDRPDGGAAQVMLVDVAGLDEPCHALDEAVQQAARAAINRAELLLCLVAPDDARSSLFEHLGSAPRLTIGTKSDLGPPKAPVDLTVSARTGHGLDHLRRRIADALADRAVSLNAQLLALQPRHRAELTASLDHLAAARQRLIARNNDPRLHDIELIADMMRSALTRLGEVGGQMTPDDVIGKVFAAFCIGK